MFNDSPIARLRNVSNGWLNVNGFAPGETYWWWDYWYGYEYDDGFDCRYAQDEFTGSEPTQVAPSPDHLVVLVDVQGYTDMTNDSGGRCATQYFLRQVQVQVVSQDSNGAAPVGQVSVKEMYDRVTTNTCGNGQPSASGCGPTTNSGTFIENIAPGCGSANGPANCGYDIDWKWYWCGSVSRGIVPLALLNAQVRRDGITLNGRSSGWPNGTAFRP